MAVQQFSPTVQSRQELTILKPEGNGVNMIRKLMCSLTLLVFAALAPSARAALIFDLSPDNRTTYIGADDGVGQGVVVSTTTTVTQMAMDLDMPNGGDIKYMIFEVGTLLFSQTLALSASSTQAFVLSDPFSFTLNAGSTYYFGVIGDNDLDVGYIFPTSPHSENGLTAVDGDNTDYVSFATPFLKDTDHADIGLRLYGNTTAVPEPGSLMLCAAGLVLAGMKAARVKGQKSRVTA